MRPHPFLRAYMAGIMVPTLFLLVVMSVFAAVASDARRRLPCAGAGRLHHSVAIRDSNGPHRDDIYDLAWKYFVGFFNEELAIT